MLLSTSAELHKYLRAGVQCVRPFSEPCDCDHCCGAAFQKSPFETSPAQPRFCRLFSKVPRFGQKGALRFRAKGAVSRWSSRRTAEGSKESLALHRHYLIREHPYPMGGNFVVGSHQKQSADPVFMRIGLACVSAHDHQRGRHCVGLHAALRQHAD